MINLLIAKISIYNNQLDDGLNYFLIFLLFTLIIIRVIIIIFFAKWLTLGPKIMKKWHNIKNRNSEKSFDGVKVKGKQIIVDQEYIVDIEEKIKKAETPQELLEYQILKENHEKQKIKAEKSVKEKEDVKLEKIEAKANRSRINSEAKSEAEKIKLEQKFIKKKNKKKKEGK
ncbi:MAG: hypothetical protein HRS50_00840 [Mycoplasmataceae bacterium]|nr:hypothetical protein [Mycoplasmataceae bacterium]